MKLRLTCMVAVIFSLAALAGCGSSGEAGSEAADVDAGKSSASDETTALELVRLSEKTTVEAGSARFAMNMTFPGDEGMPGFTMDMRGVQDLASGDADFDMTMPMMPVAGGLETRVVDEVIYQRYPDEMRQQMGFMPEGKEWISTNLDEQYQKQYGVSFSDMENAASSTPADQLDYLRSVGSVKKIGTENLDGVRTNHYRAVVDLDRELESLDGGREVTEYYRNLEEQLGTDEFPMDVWLDREGRVRKQFMEMPLPETAPIEGIDGETTEQPLPEGEMTVTMTFGDFGVPVDVKAPDSESVMTQEEFMEMAGNPGTV